MERLGVLPLGLNHGRGMGLSIGLRAAPSLVLGVILLAGGGGCRGAEERGGGGGGSAEDLAAPRCTPAPFEPSNLVAEASGAVLLPPLGANAHPAPALLVVGDSGNGGAYAVVHATTGETLATGSLPMPSNLGDDLEGLTLWHGQLVAIMSSGYVVTWRIDAPAAQGTAWGFTLVGEPYPIDPADTACAPRSVNCGANYEGLCVRDDLDAGAEPSAPSERCVGFAASKRTGELVCVVARGGKLVLDGARRVAVAGAGALADCAVAPDDGAVWTGANAFGGLIVKRLTEWDQVPVRAPHIEMIGPLGGGFPEVIVVGAREGARTPVYRMSDLSAAPSLQWLFHCR